MAVVSGRDRLTLARLVPPAWLAIGSYGLELPPEVSASGHPEGFDAAPAREALVAAGAELRGPAGRGARIETKAWGLSLHFREAGAMPGPEAVPRLTELAARHGLRIHPGRMVLEFRPESAPDKGQAVTLLAERLRPSALLYAGDDLGDLPAFAATRAAGRRIPTAAIGIASSETPAAALEAACDLVLTDRTALSPLLTRLAQARTR